MAFTYLRTVRFQDTDAAGVVYFANVLNMCHEAYEASLMQAKIDLKTFFKSDITAIPIIHANIDFKQPIVCSDQLIIHIQPKKINPSQFEVHYSIVRVNQVDLEVANAVTQHVCIHPDNRKRQSLSQEMLLWLQHNSVEAFLHSPDTVVVWEQGKILFFQADEYICFDLNKNCFDWGYPKKISQGKWSNFPRQFTQGIDAAVLWNNGKAFFFKDDEYLRYDLYQNQVDPGYPQKLESGNWLGWPEHFYQGIDAAVLWNNGKAFFFKDNEYIRYDIYQEMIDPGYPKKIKESWPGLPKPFTDGVNAVIQLNHQQAYFFKDDKYIKYDILERRTLFSSPQKVNDHWFYSGYSMINQV
ncbi:MAG: hemopexin repeat-containing protein [Microcoleaceae cyanobacterium]